MRVFLSPFSLGLLDNLNLQIEHNWRELAGIRRHTDKSKKEKRSKIIQNRSLTPLVHCVLSPHWAACWHWPPNGDRFTQTPFTRTWEGVDGGKRERRWFTCPLVHPPVPPVATQYPFIWVRPEGQVHTFNQSTLVSIIYRILTELIQVAPDTHCWVAIHCCPGVDRLTHWPFTWVCNRQLSYYISSSFTPESYRIHWLEWHSSQRREFWKEGMRWERGEETDDPRLEQAQMELEQVDESRHWAVA